MIDLSQVIIKPLITEKTMSTSDLGKYAFRVSPQATKGQIKRAAKKYLDVDVVKVNISKVSGKKRIFGKVMGQTKDWKKAVLTIKPGQKIELFES